MTASASSSCPGRPHSKSSSAVMSPVSPEAMAASIGASAANGGSACNPHRRRSAESGPGKTDRSLPFRRRRNRDGKRPVQDRKRVVSGKSVSVLVDLGGGPILKKKKNNT